MAKILAITHDSDRVYIAMVKNGMVEAARSIPIVSTKNSSEGIAAAIRNLTSKSDFHEESAAMALPDEECVIKQLDAGTMTVKDLEMNLPYEFDDFITAGSEQNYAYDYQVLPTEKGKPGRLLAVAVQRKAIYRFTDIAEDAKLNLVRLAPETVTLGDLVEESEMKGKLCCIVSIHTDTVMLRIYRGVECLASHEIMGGIAVIKEALQTRNVSFFEGTREERSAVLRQEECRQAAVGVASNILSALGYFLDLQILEPFTPIYLTGEGSLVPALSEELSRGVGVECKHISQLIPGKIDDEYAAVLAPAIGAALLR